MRFYARPSWQLARQVIGDLFLVLWGATWWLVGRFTDGTIRAMAEPARQTERIAGDLRRQVGDAATQAAGVPVVGGGLRQPFDGMSATLGGLASAAADQVVLLERVATVTGWIVFLMPLLFLAVLWIPRRLAFASLAGQTRSLLLTGHGHDLLALRALANQPLAEVRKVADNPIAAWRTGDPEVIARLADLELARAGVGRPRRRAPRSDG